MTKDFVAEQICHSIDTIVQQRLSTISYDNTKICTIVDNSDAKNGKYIVSDGTIKFEAYSELDSYKNNESVRVSILNGDWTQKKFIEGKYVDDNESMPLTYISPIGTILNVTGNLVSEAEKLETEKGLIANGETKEILLWSKDLTTEENRIIQTNNIFDSFILSADFRTLLSQYKIRSGEYGLRVALAAKTSPDANEANSSWVGYLSNKDMFGNPYSLTIYTNQAKRFNIAHLGYITAISVYLYQKADFTYFDENLNVKSVPLPKIELNNIMVKDLVVGFGSDVVNIPDNQVKLYCNDILKYTQNTQSRDNQKNISILWYNKDENNKYLGFSDGKYGKVNYGDGEQVYDEEKYLEIKSNEDSLIAQKNLDNGPPLDQKGLKLGLAFTQAYEKADIYFSMVEELKSFLTLFRSNLQIIDKISQEPEFLSFSSKLDDYDTQIKEHKKTYVAHKDYYNLIIANAGKLNKIQGQEVYEDKKSFIIEELPKKPPLNINNIFKNENEYIKKNAELKAVFDSLINKINLNYSSQSANVTPYNIQVSDIFELIDQTLKNIRNNSFYISAGESILEKRVNEYEYIDINNFGYTVMSLWKDIDDGTEWEDIQEEYKDFFGSRIPFEGNNNKVLTYEEFKKEEHNHYLSQLIDQIPFDDEYIAKDFSEFDNKYCIYWYRSAPEEEVDRFLGKGWKRINGISLTETYDLPANFGLPDEDPNNEGYHLPRDLNAIYSTSLNGEKEKESFQVIIFYNHELFKSDILTFENIDPLVDTVTADAHGIFQIIHGENSLNNYQLYGIDNYLFNKSESYVPRWVKLQYDGVTNKEEFLNEAWIHWDLPSVKATMLKYDLENSVSFQTSLYRTFTLEEHKESEGELARKKYRKNNDGTFTYKDPDTLQEITLPYESSSSVLIEGKKIIIIINGDKKTEQSEYIRFSKQITLTNGVLDETALSFPYKIKDFFNTTFSNNTIKCTIETKNNLLFTASISMSFNSFGTSGTNYSLIITPAGNQTIVMDNDELELKIALYDLNGNELTLYNNNDTSLEGNIGNAGYGTTVKFFNQNNLFDDPDECNNYFELTVSNPTLNTINGCTIKRAKNSNRTNVEQGFCTILEVSTSVSWKASVGESGEDGDSKIVSLKAYYPIAYCPQNFENKYYYAALPSTIVYNEEGRNPSFYSDPFEIYNLNEIPLTWKMVYAVPLNSPIGKKKEKFCFIEFLNNEIVAYSSLEQFMSEGSSEILTGIDLSGYGLIRSFMPKIKETVEKVSNNKEIKKYSLSVSNMYLDTTNGIDEDNTTNCYPILIGYQGSKIYWVQPLHILQNQYSSAVLNQWDGSLTIDEKNGTILSSMVGAGMKNTDNTFDGVLMGNVKAGSTETPIFGLFGYDHGAQSFGFKIDGTAFIGKSGSGRIEFDGNGGRIKSPKYGNEEGSFGTLIDLDDGFISIQGPMSNNIRQGEVYISNGSVYERDYGKDPIQKPYFFIESNGNRLINIANPALENSDENDPDVGYYIKSKNYSPAFFDDDGNLITNGLGVYFDLDKGILDAYNLKIISKNILIDSTEDANPFFQIRDFIKEEGKESESMKVLFNAGNEFYLQSSNFESGLSGTKINLSDGTIESYDFKLIAENSFKIEEKNYESKINIIANKDEFKFLIALGNNNLALKNLLDVTPDKFILQSIDFSYKTNQDYKLPNNPIGIIKIATNSSNLYIRNSPKSKNDAPNVQRIGSIPKGTLVRYYSDAETFTPDPSTTGGVQMTTKRWLNISPKGTADDYDGQWIYSGLVNYVSKYENEYSNYLPSFKTTTYTGTSIDIFNGQILLARPDIEDDVNNGLYQVILNSKEQAWPFQIGAMVPEYSDLEGGSYKLRRTFMVGWDGTVCGGSTYYWSIDPDGRANFKSLSSTGGEFDGASISNSTIGGSDIISPDDLYQNGVATIFGGSLENVTIDNQSKFNSGTIGLGQLEDGSWPIPSVTIQNCIITHCDIELGEELTKKNILDCNIFETTLNNPDIIFENPEIGEDDVKTEGSISVFDNENKEIWKLDRTQFLVKDIDYFNVSTKNLSTIISGFNYDISDSPGLNYIKYVESFTTTETEIYDSEGNQLFDKNGEPILVTTGIEPVYKYIKFNINIENINSSILISN